MNEDTALNRITYDFDPDCPNFHVKVVDEMNVLARNKKIFDVGLLKQLMIDSNVNKYYLDLYSKHLDESALLIGYPVFFKHWCKAALDISFIYMYTLMEDILMKEGHRGRKLEKQVEKHLIDFYDKTFLDRT